MDDLISRQAAIDAVMQYCPDDDGSCSKADRDIRELLDDIENLPIENLPSAQPEIIRCKDCRYQDKGLNESESWNLCGYRPWLHVPTEDEHYCGYAERRTDA